VYLQAHEEVSDLAAQAGFFCGKRIFDEFGYILLGELEPYVRPFCYMSLVVGCCYWETCAPKMLFSQGQGAQVKAFLDPYYARTQGMG